MQITEDHCRCFSLNNMSKKLKKFKNCFIDFKLTKFYGTTSDNRSDASADHMLKKIKRNIHNTV